MLPAPPQQGSSEAGNIGSAHAAQCRAATTAEHLSLPPGAMEEFDYRTASEAQIVSHARGLAGKRLREVAPVGFRFKDSPGVRSKGEVGAIVEAYFGIPPNTRSEADFPAAGIELKIVPLIKSSRGYRAKERTVISMIDFDSLIDQNWATAAVRKKLSILFVFFEHLMDRPKAEFPILHVALWEPDSRMESFLKDDWEKVKQAIEVGRAHLLTESMGRIMGPCTKGASSRHLVSQPVKTFAAKARSRAFALKPAFTLAIYEESTGKLGAVDSLIDRLGIKIPNFEEEVATRYERYVGRTVGEVARELGVPLSSSKSFAAGVIRRALGASTTKAKILEFERTGLTVRTPRVASSGMPYEAVSFPAFRYMELIEETWEDSTLMSQIEYMLFTPIEGARKSTPQSDCVIRPLVFWKPDAMELDIISKEWEMFVDLIRREKALDLPPASDTDMIHVRPHGRDSSDLDIAPGVGEIRKQSFWLNRAVVRQFLRSTT